MTTTLSSLLFTLAFIAVLAPPGSSVLFYV